MTTSQAYELVKAGKITGEWRCWVAEDGKEFPWGDLESRRESLIAAAEYVASL